MKDLVVVILVGLILKVLEIVISDKECSTEEIDFLNTRECYERD